jgi:hypothetical protein
MKRFLSIVVGITVLALSVGAFADYIEPVKVKIKPPPREGWYTTTSFSGPYSGCEEPDYDCEYWLVSAGAYPESVYGIEVWVEPLYAQLYFDWEYSENNGEDWYDVEAFGCVMDCWGKEETDMTDEDLEGAYFFRAKVYRYGGYGWEEYQWRFGIPS